MAKYNYFTDEKNRKVIAVSTYAKKRVKGVAVASPDDVFDYEKGRKLAKARCDAKIASKRYKQAKKRFEEARELLEYASDYMSKMADYFDDAINEEREAKTHLEQLLEDY